MQFSSETSLQASAPMPLRQIVRSTSTPICTQSSFQVLSGTQTEARFAGRPVHFRERVKGRHAVPVPDPLHVVAFFNVSYKHNKDASNDLTRHRIKKNDWQNGKVSRGWRPYGLRDGGANGTSKCSGPAQRGARLCSVRGCTCFQYFFGTTHIVCGVGDELHSHNACHSNPAYSRLDGSWGVICSAWMCSSNSFATAPISKASLDPPAARFMT